MNVIYGEAITLRMSGARYFFTIIDDLQQRDLDLFDEKESRSEYFIPHFEREREREREIMFTEGKSR